MKKLTVYGLPLNPQHLLHELKGKSFCVSYGTREWLGKQLDDVIKLVGPDQVLLVDNGAYSNFNAGSTSFDLAYQEGFEAWAADILARCPQAVVVIPDVIGGTEEQQRELLRETQLDTDRAMAIWHLNESFEHLLYLCESFPWVGFGSAGDDYRTPGTKKWHARIAAAFAAIDKWEAESGGAFIRPRIHMMRAQAQAHRYPFDSSDSTNVAVNHNRQRRLGEPLKQFAARVDAKIQKSAGPESEHQIKRPLLDHAACDPFSLPNLPAVPAQDDLLAA